MAILINRESRVLVQGITGREGRARTRLMKAYGTNIVAGTAPNHGGETVQGIPVFNTVKEAIEAVGPVDASVIFVRGPLVKVAAKEAMEAGVKFFLAVADRTPLWDVMEMAALAGKHGARFVGPNTLGVCSVGQAILGMIGGSANSAGAWFKRGPVGVISRSGGITSSIGYYLSREGVGLTTLVHVGGEPVVGMDIPAVALEFEKDPDTRAIVLFGEIGGTQEERLAELMRAGRVTKPVIAYIGGKAAKSGTRFSHAGAIVEGGRGTHEGKVAALTGAGATVVDSFSELPGATRRVLKQHGIRVEARPLRMNVDGSSARISRPPACQRAGGTPANLHSGQRSAKDSHFQVGFSVGVQGYFGVLWLDTALVFGPEGRLAPSRSAHDSLRTIMVFGII